MSNMRRREFISLLGGVAAAWPIRPQRSATPVIGYVSNWPPTTSDFATGFQQGLKEPAWSRVATSQSNIAPPAIKSIDCRRSLPIWWPLGQIRF